MTGFDSFVVRFIWGRCLFVVRFGLGPVLRGPSMCSRWRLPSSWLICRFGAEQVLSMAALRGRKKKSAHDGQMDADNRTSTGRCTFFFRPEKRCWGVFHGRETKL